MNECKILCFRAVLLYTTVCIFVPRIQSPSSCLHNSFFILCSNTVAEKYKILHNLTVCWYLCVCLSLYVILMNRQLQCHQEVHPLLCHYALRNIFYFNLFFIVEGYKLYFFFEHFIINSSLDTILLSFHHLLRINRTRHY